MSNSGFPYTIRKVSAPSEEEAAAIIDAISDAFTKDPGSIIGFGKYMDAVNRSRNEQFIRAVLRTGEVYVCEDPQAGNRIAGVAAWLPPGKETYETKEESVAFWGALKAHFLESERRWLDEYATGMQQLTVDSIGPNTVRDEWYLQRLGVRPEYFSRGIATRLIKAKLVEVSSRVVTLQCTENMLGFYQRLGWQVKGKGTFATLGGDLSAYIMLRPPSGEQASK
ncbi:hypothetical protein HDZ31DRAFT_42260 [Schizophyllum fasciatum]